MKLRHFSTHLWKWFRGVGLTKLYYSNDNDVQLMDGRYLPPEVRTMSWSYIPKVVLTGDFPILVAYEASLDELNRWLKEKGKDIIPMNWFWPNIIIRNTPKQICEEDKWETIWVGDVILHIIKGCPICKQSCTDQINGKLVLNEPLLTLGDFQTVSGDVYYAQDAIISSEYYYSKSGNISIGDSIQILKTGNPVWNEEGDVLLEIYIYI